MALAIPSVAYVLRSLVLRGGDFSPDLPQDAIVGALLIGAVSLVGIARRRGYGPETTSSSEEDV